MINYERQARRSLLEKVPATWWRTRCCGRWASCGHARLLSPEEAITLLSDVRLGVVTGLVKGVSEQDVNQLILLTQPAHLQRVLGLEMDQNTRREARADLVRREAAEP